MKKIMITTAIVIGGLLLLAIGFMAYNKIIPIGLGMHKPVYQRNNIALDGYDVTSYFKDDLVKGSPGYSATYKEVTWYFVSDANKEEFLSNPEQYIPQYGGYCAKAVSTGFAAPANPSVFTVYQDKLYIFTDEEVKSAFLNEPNSLISACNSKWK